MRVEVARQDLDHVAHQVAVIRHAMRDVEEAYRRATDARIDYEAARRRLRRLTEEARHDG